MNDSNSLAIVPVYNRRRTIEATLDSVAAQTRPPRRLIVVDDGSTDGSALVVSRWIAGQRARLDCQLITQANAGVSAARNRGLALAGSLEFVAFLDSDDLWPRDFLARATAVLAGQPRAVAATCDREMVFVDGGRRQRLDSSGIARRPAMWMLEHGANIASGTLLRTVAVKCRGGFNPQLRSGEDSALFMPLSLDGPWLHVPGAPVTFQIGRAAQLGDEGNLSRRFRDNHRQWARIYEEFFVSGGGSPMLADRECRRLLALAWFQAGQELIARGAPREAAACFRKALAWNPWRAKYRGWLLRALLRSLRRAAAPHDRASTAGQAAEPHAALAR
jgi:glycosyltransferase involved in cell wall biosynthesis